ncbi:MAG: pentapeptide repeat-containing protein [Thermotogota bacterium]|nr:pentapeptide repeat-containing protein [Thermotogota bacterium]
MDKEKMVKLLLSSVAKFNKYRKDNPDVHVDLTGANLTGADLRWANLRGADLTMADLTEADLTGVDSKKAFLIKADLRKADLKKADLTGAYLKGVDLRGADLSNTKGLTNPSEYMRENFEKTEKGYVVYKRIGIMPFLTDFPVPKYWIIKQGRFIEEVVNPCSTDDCGCGVNFGTKEWCNKHYAYSDLWKCLLHWEDLPSVVVPYNTDGKCRCGRLQLLEIIEKGDKL